MGCGGSKLGGVPARAEEASVVPLPTGLRPLLRRRLEEMKKRSHTNVLKGSQTLSKKELLRHGSSDDGDENEENEGSLKSSAKVAPAPVLHVEEKKEVIYEKTPWKDEVNKDVAEPEEEIQNHHGAINAKINANKKGDEGVDHEGRVSNFDERMLCPGSPSFRVYCIDIATSDDEQEKDGEYTRRSTGVESVDIIEPKEDERIVLKTEKRERRGKKFGIALPRRYYAGGGCMGSTHSQLVQEKQSH